VPGIFDNGKVFDECRNDVAEARALGTATTGAVHNNKNSSANQDQGRSEFMSIPLVPMAMQIRPGQEPSGNKYNLSNFKIGKVPCSMFHSL
jgi:hypothetical protein